MKRTEAFYFTKQRHRGRCFRCFNHKESYIWTRMQTCLPHVGIMVMFFSYLPTRHDLNSFHYYHKVSLHPPDLCILICIFKTGSEEIFKELFDFTQVEKSMKPNLTLITNYDKLLFYANAMLMRCLHLQHFFWLLKEESWNTLDKRSTAFGLYMWKRQ